MSPSIFYKICGNCMTHVPYDAAECACGRSFELDKPDLTRTAEAIRTESEERLYEAYLEARMQQTLDTLRAVRAECGTGGKWTREQAEKVRRTLKAVELARTELTAQRQKAVDASGIAQVAKTRRAQRRAGKPEVAPVMPAAPGFSPTMPESQRAAQARKAEHPSRPAQALQHCPHCSAAAATDARHCGCGYEFPVTTSMPVLVLPLEERLTVESPGSTRTSA